MESCLASCLGWPESPATPPRRPRVLQVQQLHPQAQLPIRATPGSAGLDLRVPQESLTLQANSRNLISIGLAIALPQGYYGRIAPRSMGVIDADYTGEVKVVKALIVKSDSKFSHKVLPTCLSVHFYYC
uniref:Deoxyuridine 5'-triphosphate nucleotidohydrolase n=1 Tax=Gopherus agassizii TaxID=38772 RepID=A0A452H120_9SAUR